MKICFICKQAEHVSLSTPNCKNVVMEKNEKGKSQIGINQANEPYEFICSIRT